MANVITIGKSDAGGRYADVLAAADHFKEDCGSATNAVAVMVRQSEFYKLFKRQTTDSGKSKAAPVVTDPLPQEFRPMPETQGSNN